MNWKELWMTLFGTTEWLGLNIGFLGGYGSCVTDCHCNECSVLVYETKSRRKRAL